jgi:aspartate kinase
LFLSEITDDYKVEFFKDATLFTIRHFDEHVIHNIEKNKKILLEQRSENTIQFIVK